VDEVRNPYRMCYTSCYTRGLEHLLEFFYPIEGLFGLVFIGGVIAYYYKNRNEINKLD